MKLTKSQIKSYLLFGVINLALLLFGTQARGDIIFSDNFNDGNANGWTVVNDSGKASNWQVVNGKYSELNGTGNFIQSFHIGSYSYYNNGFALTNYEATVEVIPVGGSKGASLGLMFRYQNNNNYYRFSISRDQGFSRLERKVNGVFKTLALNGRGPTLNQVHTITVDVNGSKILVYLDGEPLFSASDSSLSSGTIALFTTGYDMFDNVVIKDSSLTPKVIISRPTSYYVQRADTLRVSAVAVNVPSGGGVKFVLDMGTPNQSSRFKFSEPYSRQFLSVLPGDHTMDAFIVNSSKIPLSDTTAHDTNVSVGVGGNYFVAMGDSITNGQGDDLPNDNDSSDGRNLNRGFTPILNDLLSDALQKITAVYNEGLGGTKSADGLSRLNSTISRHSRARYWLILFGTNDSNGSMPVPSGKNCTEADFQAGTPSCIGTYKDNMRKIILNLQAASKVPLLAKVPFALNVPASRDQLIQDYNTVVDQLAIEHNIPVTPPDFYNYFAGHQDEFSDDLHPNGSGYKSMASCWCNVLGQSGILGITFQCSNKCL